MAETVMQNVTIPSLCAANCPDTVSNKTFACFTAKYEMLTGTA